MLKLFSKIFISSASLSQAIMDGQTREALKLISQGVDINNCCGACTPLQRSLLSKRHKCTVSLLEHGADPNAIYQLPDMREKTLHHELVVKRTRNIKLLILYGAKEPENIQQQVPTDQLLSHSPTTRNGRCW